ncbi:hypothetical protein KIH31_01120 [Paenarthrobacter sp. DKR-5]|uniref:hypothetical protein n=1 Tax=Paenarthrobacter sp. DKR-5 TaxID=2835535 RepID=UPI001BDD5526|nr:hypothetical protein [Paenarthrobacter sp. DKR-5]MBT1001188.1 hypothetical protein [Paenarthrobacter sp. DKR-5]
MQTFELTFLFPPDSNGGPSQSPPLQFDAESVDHAKRLADGMIEQESLTHRTVSIAVLTKADDELMEIKRWVREGGWKDA